MNEKSTLSDLMPDHHMDNKRLDVVLRVLEQKLLNIPNRIKKANKNVDFTQGSNESIMVDITDMTSEMYEIVSCTREFLPINEIETETLAIV